MPSDVPPVRPATEPIITMAPPPFAGHVIDQGEAELDRHPHVDVHGLVEALARRRRFVQRRAAENAGAVGEPIDRALGDQLVDEAVGGEVAFQRVDRRALRLELGADVGQRGAVVEQQVRAKLGCGIGRRPCRCRSRRR